ncbi:MAG TPA: HDOD domain-containing protein [Verrucomicrobiae bacterium]|nr:HDOD domain-containing protein [Verrucomicrobiae bacterium]
MLSVDRILERVTELPFSPVAAKILDLARDDRIGGREIARIITQDQAFTARLLKIANSPYYGQSRAVTTVTQAVPVLGIDTISSLAMALASFATLAHDDEATLSMRELWEHSIGCAIWARSLARHVGHRGAEETFIAGLLHDMGKAVFYRFFKKEFLEAVRIAEEEGVDLLTAERRLLDTDHAEAGATVATKWNLPPVLINTIAFHHRPMELPDDVPLATRKTVALVHVADSLSDHFQIGRAVELDVRAISKEVWQFVGFDLALCQDQLGAVLGEVSEFRSICDFSTAAKKTTAAAPASRSAVRSLASAPTKPTRMSRLPIQSVPHTHARAPLNLHRIMDAVKHLALLAGPEDLCPNIAKEAMSMLDADGACVFLPQGDNLEVAGVAGFDFLINRRLPIGQSLAGWVAKMGEVMVVPNIDKAAPSLEKDIFRLAKVRSHIFLPIDWAGKRLAVLSVHSNAERLWSAEQISLINTFSGFVAVTLENASLYREAEERAKALGDLNQELQQALTIKSRFIGKVSHELRSPLCVITGYANLLAEQAFGPLSPAMNQSVERIIKQANGLLTVLTYMLEMSQLDAGKLTVHHGAVDVRRLLDEAALTMPPLIAAKPIRFETDYAAIDCKVVTDPERLVQVLTLVLDNAVKFTDAGKIVLQARVENNFLEIAVQDSGIGIDSEQQKIIFEGFRQVDEEDTRRHEGIGIGLYLARRLLALLGGEISLTSEVGAGSRFAIKLPCIGPE